MVEPLHKKRSKIKKQLWNQYLGSRSEESYERYKQQRTRVKEILREAKNNTWEEFGRKMVTGERTRNYYTRW